MKWFVRQSNYNDSGWGCGYVVLPKSHKYYGVVYPDIPVHGGITLSEHSDGLNWPEIEEGWVLGFDTAHYGDTIDYWTRDRVVKETIDLALRLGVITFNEYYDSVK